MVQVSATMVKELRERSGAAMMDCKNALVQASGDFDKAFEVLRQRGIAVAGKKAARIASEGLVSGKVSADGKTAALIEINCETDFVARNPEFVQLTEDICNLVLKHHPSDVPTLLQCKGPVGTVSDYITEKIAKTGENIIIRRMAAFDMSNRGGTLGLYVHALGGKMGALVELASSKEVNNADLSATARDVAMHIVSAKPQFVSRNEIPETVIEEERRIESGKTDLAGKPPEIREKMIAGRIDKLLAEKCLLNQLFVKDPSKTITQFLKEKGSALGAELMPKRFALFILGEVDSNTNHQHEV